ncbi:MAG: ArsA family ATPase [Bacteriovoracaceae bacterium]|nr:ArsA family ATPase [Bacteriovoracaceae bacterium]
MLFTAKPIEIFCGSGGVGKTTLATARTLYLAEYEHKKTLLITIDPSKRLKDIMKIDSAHSGETIAIQEFGTKKVTFDVLLMAPEVTMERIIQEAGYGQLIKNRILKILSRPYGGMNEILSIVELQYQIQTGKYDVIVLDTPPGSHFVDFLNSCRKIEAFFDKNFMDIFNYIYQAKNGAQPSVNLLKKVVSSGINKLLGYLQTVTGGQFISDFMEAVSAIYKTKNIFTQALKLQSDLKKRETSNWFLVTSVEHSKIQEAMSLKHQARDFFHEDSYLVLNKCSSQLWEKTQISASQKQLKKLQESALIKEQALKEKLKQNFENLLEFEEIFEKQPEQHVIELSKRWNELKD